MKYLKYITIYNDKNKPIERVPIFLDGSEIEYHIERMRELARHQENLNEDYFKTRMTNHLNKIEELLKEKENDDE